MRPPVEQAVQHVERVARDRQRADASYVDRAHESRKTALVSGWQRGASNGVSFPVLGAMAMLRRANHLRKNLLLEPSQTQPCHPICKIQIRKSKSDALREARHGHGSCCFRCRNEGSVYVLGGGGIRLCRDAFVDYYPSLGSQSNNVCCFYTG